MGRLLLALLVAFALAAPAPAQNWALEFDGTDDYVVSHDFGIEYDYLTIEAWVLMLTGGTPDVAYEIVGMPLSGYTVGFQLEMDDSHFLFDPATTSCRLDRLRTFEYGEWYHVAAVYGPSNVYFYVFGEYVADDDCYAGGLSAEATHLIIGKEIPEENPHQYWRGYIDELRIWTTARTPSELVANMYGQLTGSEPGLFAYYDFNEGEGQVAHDACAASQHGRLGSLPTGDDSDPTWVFVDSPVPVSSGSWSSIKALYR